MASSEKRMANQEGHLKAVASIEKDISLSVKSPTNP